jgi:hypothetical protein
MNAIKLFTLCITFPGVAYAYVDPGMGMLVMQGIIALIGAVIFFLKNPIKFLKSIIKRKAKK